MIGSHGREHENTVDPGEDRLQDATGNVMCKNEWRSVVPE
jgi:hypothetical protein